MILVLYNSNIDAIFLWRKDGKVTTVDTDNNIIISYFWDLETLFDHGYEVVGEL